LVTIGLHEDKIFYSHRSRWLCRRLYSASSVAHAHSFAEGETRSHKNCSAARSTASPSPAKPKLGDLFKPRTSAAASPAAATAAPARGASAEVAANPQAPGGGHGLVWVNTETHVYHREGSQFYGTTKKGKYMTEADAVKEGNKPAARARQ